MSRHQNRRAGFTIVEISIVMLMMAIGMAAAAPTYFDAANYYSVDSAAKRIKADLEWAKREARMKSTNQVVNFQTDSNDYVMTGISPLNGGTNPDNLVKLSLRYSTEIDAAAFGPSPSSPTVSFNAFGAPDEGGTVTISCGNHTKFVDVAQFSGIITIR